MAVFSEEHFKIFKLIESNEFAEALDLISQMEKKEPLNDETMLIKAYLLIETDNLLEADRIYKPTKSTILAGFVKRICWALNKIVDFKVLSGTSIEDQYESAILSGDYISAKKCGISLLKERSIYLVMALILLYNRDRNENDLILLESAIKKEPKYTNILVLLVKLDILIDFVISSIQKINKRDFLFHYMIQLIYLKYPEKRDDLISQANFLNVRTENELINFLIDKLDSWDIYEIALEKNIEIKERKSFNFSMYKFRKENNADVANELLKSTHSFEIIEKILNLMNKNNIPQEYLSIYKFEENNIKDSYQNYINSKSLFNLKCLLYHLIASKKDNYLVLALFLARNEKDSFENFDIQMIFLFLCRFFLLIKPIKEIFEELNIKTIQHENFSFIWNDITLKSGKSFPLKSTYLNLHMQNLNVINNLVNHFIQTGKLDHAYDMLITKDSLCNSVYYNEVISNKLIATEKEHGFSYLLGKECSYLFAKLTKNHFENLQVNNLFSEVDGKEITEFLENDLFDLK
ncbi:hypothetical protein H312_02217, partial [Anncaliia algerae PRA339]